MYYRGRVEVRIVGSYHGTNWYLLETVEDGKPFVAPGYTLTSEPEEFEPEPDA